MLMLSVLKYCYVSHFKIFYTESNMKEKCMDHCYSKKKKNKQIKYAVGNFYSVLFGQ